MENEKRLDLIDRKELGIGYCNPLVFDKTEYAHGWNCAIEILMNAPTVDAVELPCRVGDMVYRKDGSWNVVGFECDRGGSWKVKLERWKDWFRDYHERTKVSFKSFGKTVFLTREEAESALAKMDGDGNA